MQMNLQEIITNALSYSNGSAQELKRWQFDNWESYRSAQVPCFLNVCKIASKRVTSGLVRGRIALTIKCRAKDVTIPAYLSPYKPRKSWGGVDWKHPGHMSIGKTENVSYVPHASNPMNFTKQLEKQLQCSWFNNKMVGKMGIFASSVKWHWISKHES